VCSTLRRWAERSACEARHKEPNSKVQTNPSGFILFVLINDKIRVKHKEVGSIYQIENESTAAACNPFLKMHWWPPLEHQSMLYQWVGHSVMLCTGMTKSHVRESSILSHGKIREIGRSHFVTTLYFNNDNETVSCLTCLCSWNLTRKWEMLQNFTIKRKNNSWFYRTWLYKTLQGYCKNKRIKHILRLLIIITGYYTH